MQGFAPKRRGPSDSPGTLSPNSSHFLNDVQQAVEVVGVAAFRQVHQQLGGQLPDLVVSIFRDVGEL